MMMVCVRGWVFAGKVSPQFVQLAYKVPVSGACDHQVIENPLVLHIEVLQKINGEQMWSLKENTNRQFFFISFILYFFFFLKHSDILGDNSKYVTPDESVNTLFNTVDTKCDL